MSPDSGGSLPLGMLSIAASVTAPMPLLSQSAAGIFVLKPPCTMKMDNALGASLLLITAAMGSHLNRAAKCDITQGSYL